MTDSTAPQTSPLNAHLLMQGKPIKSKAPIVEKQYAFLPLSGFQTQRHFRTKKRLQKEREMKPGSRSTGHHHPAPFGQELPAILDQNIRPAATCILLAGAVAAAIGMEPASHYLLATGALFHLASWFGEWWNKD
jgi:hypothetical protein